MLALAAAEGYTVFQTDVVQAFLHGELDDVDIYINPPARYPCPGGMLSKLLKAIYGLIQAPVKFKQEVIDWFKGNGHLAANDAQTIWIKRDKVAVIIHLYMLMIFFISQIIRCYIKTSRNGCETAQEAL